MVLTALKCDLRKDEDDNENPNAISFEQGLAKAKEIGAVKYLGKPLFFLPGLLFYSFSLPFSFSFSFSLEGIGDYYFQLRLIRYLPTYL